MALESLTNASEINMKGLTIDRPIEKQPVWFDPEDDISPRKQQALLSQVRKGYSFNTYTYFSDSAGLVALFPRLREPVLDGLREEKAIEEYYRATVAVMLEEPNMNRFDEDELFNYEVLFPTLMQKFKADLAMNLPYKKINEQMLRYQLAYKDSPDFARSNYATSAIQASLILPEYIPEWTQNRNLGEDLLEHARISKPLIHGEGSFDWWFFLEDAVSLKFLYPNLYRQLEITPDDWDDMRKFLDGEVRTTQNDYIGKAMHMKMLAAEDVRFTEAGLVFTMPQKPVDQPAIPIPVERSF